MTAQSLERARGFKEWLRGAGVTLNCVDLTWQEFEDELSALLDQVRAEERERCAKIADGRFTAWDAAEAIRQSGE